MFKRFLWIVPAIWVAGCASEQLNYNTLDLTSSSDDLVTSQVLSNLSKFRFSPYAIPSQVSITASSATTTNSLTSTATAPLGAAATITLANTLAAPLLNTTMHSHVTGAASTGVSAGDQYSQNWSLSPLEDPDQLRRLRALYRFGVRYADDKLSLVESRQALLCEYPLVQKAQDSGASSTQQTVTVNVADNTVQSNSTKDNKPVTEYIRNGCNDIDIGTPDPEFLKPPGCVICDYKDNRKGKVNKSLTFFGILTQGQNTVTTQQPLPDDLSFVGGEITGLCIPASTIITSFNSTTEIEISKNARCSSPNGLTQLTATSTQPPKSQKHTLVVNKLLANQWAIFGNARAQEGARSLGQEFAKPLGNGTYDIYLRPGYDQQYSDFVLFVLEATLQSTFASGGTSGKGTAQNPATATLPAAAQVQITN